MSMIATCIVDPQSAHLTAAQIENFRKPLGGGQINWLSPGIACEFEIKDGAGDIDALWQEGQKQAVDFVVQPKGSRRKKLLIADMDSTMIQQECIDELAAEAGIGEKVAEITARAMNGELDFRAAMKERVGLIAGLDLGAIERVLANRITYMPGGAALVATMRANGAYCALVSGGFTHFTQKVAAALGFHEHRANELLHDGQHLTGAVAEPILGRDAKVGALNDLAQKLGIDVTDAMAVGDGANDLGMLGLAGSGVALHAKPSVAAKCKIRLNFADLTGLLYLQGYAREAFQMP